MTESENNATKFEIHVNMNLFSHSVSELIDLLVKKSRAENIEKLNPSDPASKKKIDRHMKFRHSCKLIKDGFDNIDTYDTFKVIKKIYRTLSEHINYLYPEQNKKLFSLRDEKNNLVTVILGVDIGLVVDSMTEEENKLLWGHLYIMYIAAANMIAISNEKERKKPIWEVIPKLREKVREFGLAKDGLFFSNLFVGIGQGGNNFDINTMFSNLDKNIEGGSAGNGNALMSAGAQSMLSMCGVNKIFDLDGFSAKLKDLSQEDIDNAVNEVAKFTGAQNDPAAREVFSSIGNSVVKEIQEGKDIGQIFQSMFDNKSIDKDKILKTGKYFQNFMNPAKLQEMMQQAGGSNDPTAQQLFKNLGPALDMLGSMKR